MTLTVSLCFSLSVWVRWAAASTVLRQKQRCWRWTVDSESAAGVSWRSRPSQSSPPRRTPPLSTNKQKHTNGLVQKPIVQKKETLQIIIWDIWGNEMSWTGAWNKIFSHFSEHSKMRFGRTNVRLCDPISPLSTSPVFFYLFSLGVWPDLPRGLQVLMRAWMILEGTCGQTCPNDPHAHTGSDFIAQVSKTIGMSRKIFIVL